jgi:hypothetical protein
MIVWYCTPTSMPADRVQTSADRQGGWPLRCENPPYPSFGKGGNPNAPFRKGGRAQRGGISVRHCTNLVWFDLGSALIMQAQLWVTSPLVAELARFSSLLSWERELERGGPRVHFHPHPSPLPSRERERQGQNMTHS